MNDKFKPTVTKVTVRSEFVSFKLGAVKKSSSANCW